MKFVVALACLSAVALAAPAEEAKKLKFGDRCVTYEAKDGEWHMDVVDCEDAPKYTWAENQLKVVLEEEEYCVPKTLELCPKPKPEPSPPKPEPIPPTPQPPVCKPTHCNGGWYWCDINCACKPCDQAYPCRGNSLWDAEQCRCVKNVCAIGTVWDGEKCIPFVPPENQNPECPVEGPQPTDCTGKQIFDYASCTCKDTFTPEECKLTVADCPDDGKLYGIAPQTCECVEIKRRPCLLTDADCPDGVDTLKCECIVLPEGGPASN